MKVLIDGQWGEFLREPDADHELIDRSMYGTL
jgi:hypothetical protein